MAAEEQRQRELEDRQQYEKHIAERRKEWVEPISYEVWRKFLPDADNSETRGVEASIQATSSQLLKLEQASAWAGQSSHVGASEASFKWQRQSG